MQRSEGTTELTKALVAAQGDFAPAIKSKENPLLHNKYATLDDVIAAVRAPLKAHGLCFVQPLSNDDLTEASIPILETIIMHESGEWLSTSARIPALAGNRGVNDLQAFGAALTYMRRFMLSAMLGISCEEDGDGNGSKEKKPATKATPRPQPKPAAKVEPEQAPALPHWLDRFTPEGQPIRVLFWKWVRETMSLSDMQVYTALVVEHIHDYTGTMVDAKEQINDWVAAQATD